MHVKKGNLPFMDGIVIPISAEAHFQLWAEHTVKLDSYLNSAGFTLPPALYEAEAAQQSFMALLFPGHLLFNFFRSHNFCDFFWV